MNRSLRALLILNVVVLAGVVLATTGSAQLPPATNSQGIPYFNVNINPTAVPPLVNINPHQMIPKVEITRMPDMSKVEVIKIPSVNVNAAGCASRQNFQTAIGRSIAGPLVITYLNLSQPVEATLSSAQAGDGRVTLGQATSLATAFYLRNGQWLDFSTSVLYSCCVP